MCWSSACSGIDYSSVLDISCWLGSASAAPKSKRYALQNNHSWDCFVWVRGDILYFSFRSRDVRVVHVMKIYST